MPFIIQTDYKLCQYWKWCDSLACKPTIENKKKGCLKRDYKTRTQEMYESIYIIQNTTHT